MNQAQRRQAVEQYKAEKRGFFGIDDPSPCLALLRDIGLGVGDPPTPPEPAVAQPPAVRPLSEEDAAYLATHPKARRAAPWVVERFRRQAAQGGQAAAVATETSEGDDSDDYLSDEDGAIVRDGVPSGPDGRGPLSDADSEVTQEASLTSSPAAAASRQS
eukprot:4434133-Pyramimonas_sp.AAC.1